MLSNRPWKIRCYENGGVEEPNTHVDKSLGMGFVRDLSDYTEIVQSTLGGYSSIVEEQEFMLERTLSPKNRSGCESFVTCT